MSISSSAFRRANPTNQRRQIVKERKTEKHSTLMKAKEKENGCLCDVIDRPRMGVHLTKRLSGSGSNQQQHSEDAQPYSGLISEEFGPLRLPTLHGSNDAETRFPGAICVTQSGNRSLRTSSRSPFFFDNSYDG